MIEPSFTRRGFLPEQDPLAEFPPDSGASVPGSPGSRPAQLAPGQLVPRLGARTPHPRAAAGRRPAAPAAALLRPAGVPGLGLRKPGRPEAGHAPAAQPGAAALRDLRAARPPADS